MMASTYSTSSDDATILKPFHPTFNLTNDHSKDPVAAIKLALSDAPLAEKEKAPKDEFASIVGIVLYSSNQDAQIKKILGELDNAQCDLLMGVVYRLMELGKTDKMSAFNSGVLFRWHKALVEQKGEGVIVRHMTPREWI